MWFSYKKVLLTITLRNETWIVIKSVVSAKKSCPLAHFVWRDVFVDFNLPPLANTANMVGDLLRGIDKKTKANIRVGVYALV